MLALKYHKTFQMSVQGFVFLHVVKGTFKLRHSNCKMLLCASCQWPQIMQGLCGF